MSEVTFDAANFSEQLGIYDFFNVLLSGTIFVSGYCMINSNVYKELWDNMTVPKGIIIALTIYIIGMVLQELGSLADRYIFKIYKGMNQSILAGWIDENYKEKTTNKIVSNPFLLKRYRTFAKELLKDFSIKECDYDNKYVSGLVFSSCQYYVACYGKDKKIEKLRALFAMSKTLIVCFGILSILAVGSIVFSNEPSLLDGLPTWGCQTCSGKIYLFAIFALASIAFYHRAKRTMRNFLLILLGTYDALKRAEKRTKRKYRV